MQTEIVNIPLFRHTDDSGDPTCSTKFGDPGHTCIFLGVAGICGQREVCRHPACEGDLHRRKADGTGTLIPHTDCPPWGASGVPVAAKPEPKVITSRMQTNSGMIQETFGYPAALGCLTAQQREEFNVIGYTGRNSAGVKTDKVQYLNSLGYGTFTFTLTMTKFDTCDFCEEYTVTRAYIPAT